jgi:hypothetical protein
MSDAIFPRQIYGLTQNIPKTAEFSTLTQTSSNMIGTYIAQTVNPTWHWELIYEQLFDDATNPNYVYSELQTLQGFCLARGGRFDDFLFDDLSDDFVGPAINPDGSPNLQAQLQVVTDGAGNFYSPIQRNKGGQFYEDITDIGPGTITIYDNAALAVLGTDYTIGGPGLAVPGAAFRGKYVQWVTEPATPVTAQFNFYFRVEFEDDKFNFEQFLQGLWTMGGTESTQSQALKLVSSRRSS